MREAAGVSWAAVFQTALVFMFTWLVLVFFLTMTRVLPNAAPKKGKMVIFVGNIGAGKSTYLAALKGLMNLTDKNEARFFPEPVGEWQHSLELFYRDPVKHAFMFQMHTLLSRLRVFQDAQRLLVKWLFLERCLQTDKLIFADELHARGTMADVEHAVYTQWHAFAQRSMSMDIEGEDILYVYLRTTPETCAERVKKRNRVGEGCIALDYLQGCHAAHERMVQNIAFKLIVDADKPVDAQSMLSDIKAAWSRR